jgi:hypothetical protein
MQAMANELEIENFDSRQRFFTRIKVLDKEYLAYLNEEIKSKDSKSKDSKSKEK